jgi:NADP-dependent 3-hydroxy acid dehydrogenase YdfG
MEMIEPVCVISGVGPGTGSALVRRFAAGGYRIAMLARNAERLAALAGQVLQRLSLYDIELALLGVRKKPARAPSRASG